MQLKLMNTKYAPIKHGSWRRVWSSMFIGDINLKDGDPAVRLRGWNPREDEDGVAYFDVENMKRFTVAVHDKYIDHVLRFF
jgi:hypothetical protein